MNTPAKFPVTAALHPSGVITAFFDKLPAIVVQGRSQDEVTHKLTTVLKRYIKMLEAVDSDFDIHLQKVG